MKLIYADNGLKTSLGHHANSARQLVPALKVLGCDVSVAAVQDIEDNLADELGAGRVFRHHCYQKINHDPIVGWMLDFNNAAAMAMEDLETVYRPGDVIYWNSAQPAQLHGVIMFLYRYPDCRAVIEFGTAPGLDLKFNEDGSVMGAYPDPRGSATATLWRYCSHLISDDIRPRLTMATFEDRASEIFTNILDAPVSVFPTPRNAHPSPVLRGQKPELTISFLGHQRIGDKGYQFVPAIVRQVLEQANLGGRPVKFLIHNGDALTTQNPQLQDLQKQVRHLQVEYPNKVEVDERVADAVIWQELLDKSDLIVCPYWPERFYASYSAVACEALANGIPLVVPMNTSLSEMCRKLGGTSTFGPCRPFSEWQPYSIANAIVLGAVTGFDNGLNTLAQETVRAWREHHGADKTAKEILESLQ